MASTKYDTTLILSGGIDSTVLAYQLKSEGVTFRTLYLDFQKALITVREISAVKFITNRLYIPLDIVDVSGITKLQRGYIPEKYVMRDELDSQQYFSVDPTYVSGFYVLLSIGAYYAQITGSSKICLGVIKEQLVPGLRESLDRFPFIIETLNPKLGSFSIETPYIHKSKSDVIKIGQELGVPFEETWSCLEIGTVHCGACTQCVSRKKAFKKSRVADPTEYK